MRFSPTILLGLLFALIQPASASTSKEIQVSSGKIETLPPLIQEGLSERSVRVWLPNNYPTQQPYAVVYMHDGQMLFDKGTTWNGQEWGMDETASKLISQEKVRPFIVVAIDNVSKFRHGDYFPQKARDFLPSDARQSKHPFNQAELRGDLYLKYLVTTVKPYIDEHYAVGYGADDTFIAGASMGGLISLYAVAEYPDIFSTVAAISTHWPGINPDDSLPLAEAIRAYLRENLPKPGNHRFYFDHGTETLDAYYPPLQLAVDQIMRQQGYSSSDWLTQVFEGHAHDEESWSSRLDQILIFMLGHQKNK
ncbi:esterase [Microbulbifer sp. A4B17]|uniref:alpha/beta hydrolase n=1 Tax=Microbulbifer sp. A4B17 TaxID=359370 RepID=UPI000D52AD1E|nr:alpha/beta hydrolase-fold protein [Microbulbifer sp. A4B17]AWF83001.1 esterase [Microbulbifer sp. A4B17]